MRLLQVVAVAANESDSVHGALQTCLDAVCEHTGWLLGHAWLRENDGTMVSSGVWHPARSRHAFRAFARRRRPAASGRARGWRGG